MSTYLILHYTSAFINLIINIFTLYVIFTRTPSNMKNVAATILNIILWNFAGNIVWGLMPFHPLFPMNCYVLQGPLAQWLYAHDFEKYGFIFIVLFFLNACVGVQLSFQFRWIQLAAPDKLKHLGRKWAYIYSAGTHIWASVLFFYLSNSMFLTPETYPDFYPAFQNVPMFCMTPDKTKFIVLVCIIVVSVFLASGVIITLVLLSYKSLYSRRYLMSISTLKLLWFGKRKSTHLYVVHLLILTVY